MRCAEGQSPRFSLVFHNEYSDIGPLNAAPSRDRAAHVLVARSRCARVPAGGREARARSAIPEFRISYLKSRYKF